MKKKKSKHISGIQLLPLHPPRPQLFQRPGRVVPVGRVYVRDPDHWHAEEKTYMWMRPQPDGFFLDTATGHLTMAPTKRQGRWDAQIHLAKPLNHIRRR